ncbi:MAG: MBOAT family O-acyltransferase [Pseudomonadota bacterium]
MLFVEPRFFVFFAVVAALYWAIRTNAPRKYLLLAASYGFYAVWDVRFLSLILFCTALNYVVARYYVAPGHPRAKLAFWIAIWGNLAVLALFKYFNFFADSLVDLASLGGVTLTHSTLNIVLPVGISFYTFQAMSYLIDVRRKDIQAETSFTNVALYIAFFPQLVAGPIVRAADFLPQLKRARIRADVAIQPALILFMLGFIKKACISDNIAPFVDEIFANPAAYTTEAVISGVLLYGVQIYCDFSGYSDMAIATAMLLGYQFPKNFDAPYLSSSITIFWRRWHISLSSWLRDYLYIPLGGNRLSAAKRDRNLMTTMVLGGLWHGASYNFLIWGFLHGLALIVNREWARRFAFLKGKIPLADLWGTLATIYWVFLAWIFFRAETLPEAWQIAVTWLTLHSPGTDDMAFAAWPFLIGFAGIHFLGHRYNVLERAERAPLEPFAALYGAVAALAIAFLPTGYRPFVYFQF